MSVSSRVVSAKQAVKSVILPEPGVRTMPFGLAAGVRMHVDFAEYTRVFLGLYEIELNRYLRQMLRPGVTTFDIGVQHGYDSLMAAKLTGARVVSFDRDPECVKTARRNFNENPGLSHLFTLVAGSVGVDAGEVTLDEWAFDRDVLPPDFLKIDIDGGEVGALLSADRILSEHRPAVIVETHSPDLEQRCGAILVDHGYSPVVVNQRIVWPDKRPIPHNRWLVAFA